MNLNKVLNCFVIVCLSLSYFIYSTLFNINYYFAIATGIILIVIWLLLKKQVKDTYSNTKIFRTSFFMLVIPEIILVLYSLVIVLPCGSQIRINKYFSRSLLFVITVVEGAAVYGLYKKNAVDAIYKSAILNYIIYIVSFIKDKGILNLFTYTYQTIFKDVATKSILEAHEVTFVFGLLFIYYVLVDYKNNKRKVIVCLIMSILGFKRIMVIAVLISLLVFLFLDKFLKIKNTKNRITNKVVLLISIVTIFSNYMWLYITSNDEIARISEEKNINFMGRLGMYELIKNEYDIKLSFFGKGLGYIAYWGENNISKTNGVALHSGIIQMYVENGFWIYMLYLINKLYFNYKRIKKIDENSSNIYFSILLYIIICWFTDNVATYYNFLLASNVIIMSLYNNSKIKEEELLNDTK